MGTARLIYISLGILIITPIIAFNIKRFTTKKEGEQPKLNQTAILIVTLICCAVGVFIFSHYKFTSGYQPHLVLERYASDYAYELSEGKESVRFQLGEIIYPRYYFDKDFFPFNLEVDEQDRNPVFIPFMIEINDEKVYYMALLDIDEYEWRVHDTIQASEELTEYAVRFNFMKAEHANKWFDVKK